MEVTMSKNKQLTVPITVPLDQIRISERRRRGLSVSTVERYRQWLEQGREAPPVRLIRLGDGFVVQDGRHRVVAAHAAGQLEIDAEVTALARLRTRALSTVCRLWRGTARAAERFRRSPSSRKPMRQ
jgi:ParB-like chromosome segregation protein Spo0J